jgi:hypothetical protein
MSTNSSTRMAGQKYAFPARSNTFMLSGGRYPQAVRLAALGALAGL